MKKMKNLLYIHIPKTGGVTVNNSLIKNGYKNRFGHNFAKNIQKQIPKEYNKLIKFTTVRNPWSRLVSVYTFLTKGSDIHRPPEYKELDKLNVKSFTEFIHKLYNLNSNLSDVYINPSSKSNRVNLYTLHQSNWIYDNEGNQIVDYICKLDTLSEDIKTFNKQFGFSINLISHQNQTSHQPYTTMYNDETQQMVKELYKKEIKNFNFKFKK